MAIQYGLLKRFTEVVQPVAHQEECDGDIVVAMINAGADCTFTVNTGGMFEDILTGEKFDLSQGVAVSANNARVFKKI